MEHEAAQHGINWTQVLLAVIGQVGVIIILWMKQRSDRQSLERTIADAKKSVNEKVGEVHDSVEQNTLITKYGPEATAAKIEHKLANGLGDHIAAKTAEKVKEDASKAAVGVASELVKAEAVQQVIQLAANEISSTRSSDSFGKGHKQGVAEGFEKGYAAALEDAKANAQRRAAETDLEIPIPKPKDKG